MVAGFPCKGLSRNRIDNLPNKGFNHKESGLFIEIPSIMSLLRRLAKPLDIELHHIIENVKMKKEEHDTIRSVLNGIPVMIQASRCCGSSRPRLFWTSFEVTPLEGESFEKGDKTNVLHMKQVPNSTLGSFGTRNGDHIKTSSSLSRALHAGSRSHSLLIPQPR